MSETSGEGLRERKRRATRDAIERHALELVITHGYDNVTVEMICDAAMISQRTFFNYAGSKERAVLGIEPPLPSPQQQDEYVTGLGGSPLRDLLATMVAAFAGAGPDHADLTRKRQQVMMQNPALALGEFARMQDAQQVVVALIRRRLQADRPGADPSDTEADAAMTFSLAFGIMHNLAHNWIGKVDELSRPDQLVDDALARAARALTARPAE
ncbi:TetR/AcrR family transcriptional regulator [Microbacterium sp. No. 7]|uniref:TetR/AcrR family transcriptional regulator n=1 Tax=Microbacterium sp. No. 7 TaxID=1714373 RepID=UPI0006D051E2|nr:TetR/AcrR family transcriptional regulator [Microbacterium sp. No. 7]